MLLLLRRILVHNIDLLIGTLLVDLDDVVLSLLHKDVSYIRQVSGFTSLLNFVGDLWILSEQVIQEELFAQGYGLDLIEGHVDELRLLVKAYVVVANISAAVMSNTNLELLL